MGGRIEKDPEMMAMGKCIDLLSRLGATGRHRVLAYLNRRWPLEEAPPADHAPADTEADDGGA